MGDYGWITMPDDPWITMGDYGWITIPGDHWITLLHMPGSVYPGN
jgi:hypothetical protein